MSAEKLEKINTHTDPMHRLLEVMTQLRNPEGGCPWDLEQDYASIAKYTIEEAYEVADAIARNDMDDLKDELGDLLLQVVFHAQLAKDGNLFTFENVARHVADKMIERHPHVFQTTRAETAEDVVDVWETQKEKQKPRDSALDGVTLGLPALMRAQKLQKRAARVGFEWPDVHGAIDKFKEEMAEFEAEMTGHEPEKLREEFGDVMFTLINIGRMLGYDVEEVTREANTKFESRFKGMEKDIKLKYKELNAASLDEMEAAWQRQKTAKDCG
jgi:ATP diphosphatase